MTVTICRQLHVLPYLCPETSNIVPTLIKCHFVLLFFVVAEGKGRADSELNQDQREQRLKSIPTPLEYFTFMINFHSLLAGPVCTIRDYLVFMDGSNFKLHPPPGASASVRLLSPYNCCVFSALCMSVCL